MIRLPGWARSVRLRLALLYSVLVFAVAAVVVGTVNVAISRTLAGEPVSQDFQITSIRPTPGGFVIGETTVRAEMLSLERLVNERTLTNLRRMSFVTLGALFPVSVLIGWLVAGRVLRPVERITAVARDIQTTDLSRRIELEGPDDELRHLADTFDAMLDRVEQGVREQQAFIEDASHELRNPLAVMGTTLDVALADTEADVAELRRTAEVVRRTLDRTSRTVDDLVTYARREVPAERRATFDAADLVGAVAEEYEAAAAARGITLERTGGATEVNADRDALRKAFGNLLDNAVRLAPGGSRIRCGVGASGDWTWLGVADQGPGLAASEHSFVFQRAWSGSVGRSGGRGGSGLGLAIARQVAESHGGVVTLSSEPGVGSSFVVWIPTARGTARTDVTVDGIHPHADPFAGG